MRAKITQKISGEGDSLERNLAVKCSQGKNKRQDQQSTQQTATTQTRQDWVPQRVKKRRRQDKIHRELPWVPQELSAKNEVQNWFVQQAQVVVKLNKQGKVKLKQTKLRKIPSPPLLTQKNRLTGTLVLFLRQYYPGPFTLVPLKLTRANHPRWMFAPLELKSGYPVPRGLSRYSLEPNGLSQRATEIKDKNTARTVKLRPSAS